MMMKSEIKKLAAAMKPVLESVASVEARFARAWAAAAHKRLFKTQWSLPPEPEFFDHNIDLYWGWGDSGNSLWVERGVYSSLAFKPGARVLELCCGTGFNSKHFYAHRASHVTAVDFDPKAIETARKNHPTPNIEFRVADIRTSMPEGPFDNVVWDAAIEHFTVGEINDILKQIKRRFAPGGVLSGYTIVERDDGNKSLSHHEYEFKDKDDLMKLLQPHFKNVWVFETIYPSRHNLYFWAGDATIPFSKEWALGKNVPGASK